MNEKKQKITKILSFFSEMYNKALTESTVAIYIEILEQFETDKIERAFQSLIRDHALSRFPLPADFIKHLDPPAEKTLDARRAFNIAVKAVELQCRINTVQFGDPLIAKTIVALSGNWINFCQRSSATPPEDFVFFEKDFVQIYEVLKQRRDDDPPPLLEGQFDRDNRAKGYLTESGNLRLPGGEEIPSIGQILKKAKEAQ